MALMIRTIHIDTIPARRKEVIDSQTVGTGLGGEVPGIPLRASDFRVYGRGAPGSGEAAESDALKFVFVGRGSAVGGVAD